MLKHPHVPGQKRRVDLGWREVRPYRRQAVVKPVPLELGFGRPVSPRYEERIVHVAPLGQLRGEHHEVHVDRGDPGEVLGLGLDLLDVGDPAGQLVDSQVLARRRRGDPRMRGEGVPQLAAAGEDEDQ